MAAKIDTRILKKELAKLFPFFKLSVTTQYGGYSKSINILIKNFDDIVKTAEDYEKIIPDFVRTCQKLAPEKVFYDSKTQEILLGGNTYVMIRYESNDGIMTSLPYY
ncbi:MAG: hypothetical protein ACKPCI_19570 [Dolichospermum sp.]